VVRDVLYRDFKRSLSQPGIDPEDEKFRGFLKGEQRYKEEHPGLRERMEKRFASLTAIVKLCSAPASREDKKKDPPQRRIRAVLTYNVDALIQIYDRARHGRRVFRTVERSSKRRPGAAKSLSTTCMGIYSPLTSALSTRPPTASSSPSTSTTSGPTKRSTLL